MKLLAFRVTEFRSVDDSGWIETDDVTALIGTNESGKTNVLVPLWKLKPANGGAIDALADYPRKRYNEIRAMKKKPVFIRAKFELPPALVAEVAKLLKVSDEQAKEVIISRDFNGKHYVQFHKAGAEPTVSKESVDKELKSAAADITGAKPVDGDEAIQPVVDGALKAASDLMDGVEGATLDVATRKKLLELAAVELSKPPAHSVIAATRRGRSSL